VILKVLTRATLIVIPIAMIATRLHARLTQPPLTTTQEVNRCLLLVHTAASRRGKGGPIRNAPAIRPLNPVIAPVTGPLDPAA
jgi:hypothetical protein